jgi:hypothetical protein
VSRATKTTDEENTMNVKKMTTEELQEQVEMSNECSPVNSSQEEFWTACRKELMRRWGIKQ